MKTVLAIDIGATKIGAGVVDESGAILSHCLVPTPALADSSVVMEAITRAADVARADFSPGVCGVGVCGGVRRNGTVWTLNIESLRDFQLRDALADWLNLPIVMENDAVSMTLAEGWLGAAKGIDNYFALVVSTGIGGGIVMGGNLLRGVNGEHAGRIGHTSVEPNGRLCLCGGRGCLEAEASGSAIEAITGRSAIYATPEVIEHTAKMVGRGIANTTNLLNIDTALIGGSVALGFGEPFFSAVRKEAGLLSTLNESVATELNVQPVGLGKDSPLLGAARVALL